MPFKRSKSSVNSGSPAVGEPEYLVVGVLRRPYGLKGELVMEVITDFPEQLKVGSAVYVGVRRTLMTISSTRKHPEGLAIKLLGVDSPEAAGDLRKQAVFVKTADRPPLPAGTYYHHELIGFRVVNQNGESIGTLREILQTGANDVYVVSQDQGGEILLPAIASVVLGVEKENKKIRIQEMPGLGMEGTR